MDAAHLTSGSAVEEDKHLRGQPPLKDPAGGMYGTLDVAAVEDIAVGENTSPSHPSCDVGCTQSMLGLLNSGPSHDLQTTLKCQSWAKPDIIKLMEILTESWRRGVALLYSNLELLLPLPVRTQPSPLLTEKKVTRPRLQSEPPPSDPLILDQSKRAWASGWAGSQRLEGEQMGRGMEKLTLPVAPPRRGFNISQTTSCDPSVVERRYDVIRTVLSSRAFCTLGNKQAVAVVYLPVLRTLCLSERTQEQGQCRFLHYLSSIHLGLPKATETPCR
ncbi:ATPase family AAA domain-containing protein 5-like [Salvelinus namaycush]|uniref:ATPase family AAA domain-containing protein 5-like n=1 Tax=Salvelinus namaycush TaxID=8040 RepID=A0A8U0U050_SALNM|nr:ATPase family AAA domain-containing protein 5-like [Salvelinus namaycush]